MKRIERFCWDWFICSVPDERLLEAFPLAMDSYDDMSVVNSYPELLRRQGPSATRRPQWHLYETEFDGTEVDAHIHAEEAWKKGFEGDGATIALIDDGFDTQHEEFQGRGNQAKVVASVTIKGGVVRNGCRPEGPHGTRCGGVACANGNHGAFGVAPKAAIMPIGCGTSPLAFNSLDVSLALRHAADCGADVVTCSWNPQSLPCDLPPLAD
ncbi:MAG: S8 family serine peptidase, partial [Vicinamibacteria bacterium]